MESDQMLWDMLKSHIGHQVRIVAYGDTDDPMDICLECEECGEVILDAIRSTITFLSENEEYGDDWSEEIATLDKVMDFCLEHGHRDE